MRSDFASNSRRAIFGGLAILAVGLWPLTVRAQRAPFRTHNTIDGVLTGSFLLGSALVPLIPVDTESRWESEPFCFDESVKENFSSHASRVSDNLLVSLLIAPVVLLAGARDANEGRSRTLFLYGETLAAALLLNTATKYAVQRPRPYVYNPNPAIQRYAESQGRDSHLSFFSGHATMTFAAAVGGAYLFAADSDRPRFNAAVWGVGLAAATATADLRVRAGKHYYSDVVAGALLGAAVGVAVPYLHHRAGETYTPRPVEWGAMAAGVTLGAVAGQLLPIKDTVALPLDNPGTSATVRLVPTVTQGGIGLLLQRSW